MSKSYDAEDMGMTEAQLEAKYGLSGSHPYYRREQWEGNPSTIETTYWGWVEQQCKSDDDSHLAPPQGGTATRITVERDGESFTLVYPYEGQPYVENFAGMERYELRITGSLSMGVMRDTAFALRTAQRQLDAQDEQFKQSNETIKSLLTAVETLKQELPWPDKLTEGLSYVLGLPNFRCGPIAEVYRRSGHDIARKSEAEQAFVLHRFARIALKHPQNFMALLEKDLMDAGAATYAKVQVPDSKIIVDAKDVK